MAGPSPISGPDRSLHASALGALWIAVLAVHALAAAIVCWIMPGGFPLAHPRFWTNRGIPAALLALIAAALSARLRQKPRAFGALIAAVPAAWAGAAVSARVVFPESAGNLWIFALGSSLGLAAAAAGLIRRSGAAGAALPIAGIAALTGALLPLFERAPAPGTHPRGGAIEPAPDSGAAVHEDPLLLGEALAVDPRDASIEARRGALQVTLWPLLTFEDRSPDGAWTVLAPSGKGRSPGRALVSVRSDGESAELHYRDDGRAALRVRRGRGEAAGEIEALTLLPRAIDSHLNAFSQIEVQGHTALAVAFSPCPEARIDVTYAEYPSGLPLRFAYLDDAGVFHVMEGKSAEKGPYRELGRGPMQPRDALGITLLDGGVAVWRIVLEDWAAQASTALSPTAGWGVASNSIALRRAGPEATTAATLSISLADTGVGRGWDSVGHAAGVYRNRVRLEAMAPAR